MKFQLDPLPYEMDALEPHISRRTLNFHYDKHHKGYLQKLEKAIEDTPMTELDLVDIVLDSDGDVFRNAAQVWNHSFYWKGMTPKGGGKPGKKLAERLKRDLGGVDSFKQEFAEVASGEFGSGWAWLVENQSGRLSVVSTSDADNPIERGLRPILTLDVWEHAYYLDYQNDRASYIEAYLDHLVNWSFAESNLMLGSTKHPVGNAEFRLAP